MEKNFADLIKTGFMIFFALSPFIFSATSYGSNVKIGNIQPGDADYPKINLHPEHTFSLHGTMNPTLDVNFVAGWSAANPSCRFRTGVLDRSELNFTVLIPIDVEHQGDNYSATIADDGILPGRCGWKFDGISYSDSSKNFLVPLVRTDAPIGEHNSNGIIQLNCKKTAGSCKFLKSNIIVWRPETTNVEVDFISDSL